MLRQLLIIKSDKFTEWFQDQTDKDSGIILERIIRIEFFSYFGDFKDLRNGLFELRWRNGRRIYFSRIEEHKILLLNGGLKNGQKKDIKEARSILRRYADS